MDYIGHNRSKHELPEHSITINNLIDGMTCSYQTAFKEEIKVGFDVVIGNPPYVRLQNIDESSRNYFASKYKTAFKNYDLYVLFTEKINAILKSTGEAAFIMPNKFITTEYGEKLKNLLFEKNFLYEYIDFSTFQVFDDATTYTGIFIFNHDPKKALNYYKVLDEQSKFLNTVSFTKVNYINLKSEKWIFMDEVSSKLFHRLENLEKIKNSSIELFVGLQTSADPVFILEIRGNKLYSKQTKKYYDFGSSELLKPLLKGAEIRRYSTPIPNFKLIFPYKIQGDNFNLITEEEMINDHFYIWEYLKECKTKLEGRENGKMKNERWYGYVYLKNMTLFDQPKILTQVLCKQSSLSLDLDNKNYFVGGGTAGGYGISISKDINPYSLIAILNSRFAQWYIKQFASPFQGGYYAYNKGTIGEIPLPKLNGDENRHEYLISKIRDRNDDLNRVRTMFMNYISSQYSTEKLSRKLQNWHDLYFNEFIKELNKAIKATNKIAIVEAS